MNFKEEMEAFDDRIINASYEKVSIKKVRLANGLPELKEGVVKCLRCEKRFNSYDKGNNRICDTCKEKHDYDYPEHKVEAYC